MSQLNLLSSVHRQPSGLPTIAWRQSIEGPKEIISEKIRHKFATAQQRIPRCCFDEGLLIEQAEAADPMVVARCRLGWKEHNPALNVLKMLADCYREGWVRDGDRRR